MLVVGWLFRRWVWGSLFACCFGFCLFWCGRLCFWWTLVGVVCGSNVDLTFSLDLSVLYHTWGFGCCVGCLLLFSLSLGGVLLFGGLGACGSTWV